MNPSAAGNAARADATTVGPEHLVRCLLQFVPNVESTPKYPSNQLKDVRYSVWNASRGKNKQHYKIRLKNRASRPVFNFSGHGSYCNWVMVMRHYLRRGN